MRRYVTRRSSCTTEKLNTPNIRWHITLFRSAHPYGSTAMVVFQPAIETLRRAALAIANVFRRPVPDQALQLRLLRQFLLQPGVRRGLMSMIGS